MIGDKKIVIDGRIPFLLFLLVLILFIPISFAGSDRNNAVHYLYEITRNGVSVDINRNGWVDNVDYTHKMEFVGIVGDLSCSNGIMTGINQQGAICLSLAQYYNDISSKCWTESSGGSGSNTIGCGGNEMVYGTTSGGCPSTATIYCCEASLPKAYDGTDPRQHVCVDSDAHLGNVNQQIFTKGTATIRETGETRTDICITEIRLQEFYCESGQIKSEYFTCNNGCRDGACLN